MSFADLFKIRQIKAENEYLKQKRTDEAKSYTAEINKLNEKLTATDKKAADLEHLLLDYKKKINGYLSDYIESKEVNADSFYTNAYKQQFESFIEGDCHNEEEILNKYNELYNKESIYFEGIVSCIDFIRTKRNPKVSTEKQILKFMLTDAGRSSVDSYINAIALKGDK